MRRALKLDILKNVIILVKAGDDVEPLMLLPPACLWSIWWEYRCTHWKQILEPLALLVNETDNVELPNVCVHSVVRQPNDHAEGPGMFVTILGFARAPI